MIDKITMTALCYQEIRFIRGWLENMLLVADRILISEGGSTDGTVEIIQEYCHRYPDRIEVFSHRQSPFVLEAGCDEGPRRNNLIERVTEGFVAIADIDEFWPDDARERLAPILSPDRSLAGKILQFWRSPHLVRMATPVDTPWTPSPRAMLFPAGSVRYSNDLLHARPKSCPPWITLHTFPIYHYHYLFAEPKHVENRIGEWNGTEDPDIYLKVFTDPHPTALNFLTETVNFGTLLGPSHR